MMPADLPLVPTMAMFHLNPKEEHPHWAGGGRSVPDVLLEDLELDIMAWEETSLELQVESQGIKLEEEHRGGSVAWEHNNAMSLNLRLNFQDVLDAWSDRGPPWVDHHCLSSAVPSHDKAGEVPNMEAEEEERQRRRARVLKYREKRHCRLFSKKIRYEVRRLNAEKRPRMKGRFVKGNFEKISVR